MVEAVVVAFYVVDVAGVMVRFVLLLLLLLLVVVVVVRKYLLVMR